jgi:protein-S-isoprenylcysteine O-methyltransferase Ste14
MPGYAYAILTAGWLIWMAPFLLAKRPHQKPKDVDRRARWGVLLEALAYAILWQNSFWARPLPSWRLAVSVFFLAIAAGLSWTATRSLGRQWRIEAGLSPDHELITSGPYARVRHPIYTSMLFLLWGIGFMVTPLRMLLLATAVFIVGTEIRVRIEDRLLASRFGDEFRRYQRSVPPYIPFVK